MPFPFCRFIYQSKCKKITTLVPKLPKFKRNLRWAPAEFGMCSKHGNFKENDFFMSESETFGSFLRENKSLLKEYIETRIDIYRLQSVRLFSKSAGYLIWIVISIFLFFLIVLFGGLVLGFWLSGITGSYTAGFGITTLFFVLIFVVLLAARKKLFIDPMIRNVLQKAAENEQENEDPEA